MKIFLSKRNWLARALSLGHYAWGTLLLLLAGWIVISAFRVLPYMSSGTILSNLPTAMIWALTHAGPFGVLGSWMLVLGRRIWNGHGRVRKALLATHGLLLVPGFLAVIIGIYGLRATERSMAKGGGLLSPYAAVPLVIGVPVVALAVLSIFLALTAYAKEERPQLPE